MPIEATLYRNPGCGCCLEYARYLRRNGFDVDVSSRSMTAIREKHGVPDALEGCHVTVIGDYVVEGHVPADVVQQLLTERPRVKGIAVPGMPIGSPGMEQGATKQRYSVFTFDDAGKTTLYATR